MRAALDLHQDFYMYEFQTFVYLPVQKTGTTFISRMLDKFSKEELVQRFRHRGMNADCDRGKFYFISVRDPLDAYISLYSYGHESRGKMSRRLESKGLGDLYDGTASGFNAWLSYILKVANTSMLNRDFAKAGGGSVAELIGLQSYRYLSLALPGAGDLLSDCRSKDDIRAAYAQHKLPRYVVRYENFIADLCALVRGPLSYAISDVDEAVKFIEETPPINASQRIDENGEIAMEESVHREFVEREWFLHEEFGY